MWIVKFTVSFLQGVGGPFGFFCNYKELAMLALKVYVDNAEKYHQKLPPMWIELGDFCHSSLMVSYLN